LLELARAELGESRVAPLSDLDWSELRPEDAILLLHPDHAIASKKLTAFLDAGGRVAVVDDFGAGDKILESFEIERVPPPRRPLSTLRHNPELAIAEPVRRELDQDHTTGVHASVQDVEHLMTNHPTGLRNPNLTQVLRIRSVDGTDVIIALAGDYGKPPRGKLFAMSDPSVFTNQMLRYPGNRAFAVGLVRYLGRDTNGEPRGGRLFIIANQYSESGAYAGASSTLRSEIDGRLETAGQELRKLLGDGLSGVVGLALAGLVALGVGIWTTTVASRVYRRRLPSFARPVPLVAQGGMAGRAAVLAAQSTPYSLVVLELKSALEEGLAHELGFGRVSSARLLEEIMSKRALDERAFRALKGILLEMARVETLVAAGQSRKVKRADVLRLSSTVFAILGAVRASRRERTAA
jgi:hypothetical protein